MVVKNFFFVFIVFVIIIMGLTIYPVLADEPNTENKSVTIDKKAAAIENYKAELAAKAAKKTESIEIIVEETVVEIEEEVLEVVEIEIDANIAEIKDEVTGTKVEEDIKIDDEMKATETLKEEVSKEEHPKPEHPKAEHPK